MKKLFKLMVMALVVILPATMFAACDTPDLTPHTHAYVTETKYVVDGDKAYKSETTACKCGKSSSTTTQIENAIIATPENAQEILDGNINGKVIVFTGTFTEDLNIRPTIASGAIVAATTDFDSEAKADVDINNLQTNTAYIYRRSIENVSFVATDATVFAGKIAINTRWHGNNTYDPVKGITSPVGHTEVLILNNITFANLNFAGGQGRLYLYGHYAQSTNLVVNNCSFKTDTTVSTNNVDNAAIMIVTSASGIFNNSTFTNNYIDGHAMGIYIPNANTVTICGNTIMHTRHNAIAVQTTDSRFCTGTILIENNNISKNLDAVSKTETDRAEFGANGERAMRIGNCDAATILIKNNNFDYCYKEIIVSPSAAGSFKNGTTFELTNNYYAGTKLNNVSGTDSQIYVKWCE